MTSAQAAPNEDPASAAAVAPPVDPANTSSMSAQADENGSLGGDIVVTAQRRSQNVQDVGIAITAVSGAQLRSLGFTSSLDIAKLSSNIAVSGSYGGLMSQYSIRGITQNDFHDHVEGVVATYIDDTYVAMQQGSTFTLFDIDRVEALKGPQGTLFGRNATAGLVHFLSRRPTDEFEGYADVTYASYDNARFEGALSGPIANGVAARFSGMFERSDGFLKNFYPNTFTPAGLPQGGDPAPGSGADLGGVKSDVAVRGQVTADISDNVKLWTSGFYSHLIAGSAPYQLSDQTISILDANGLQINNAYISPTETCRVIRAGVCTGTRPVPGADFYGYRDPDGRGLDTSVDYAFDDGSQTKVWGGSAKLTIDFGDTNLTWISDYKRFDKNFLFDLSADATNSLFDIAVSKENTLSQELRLAGRTGPLTWVTGAYFLRINNDSANGIGALPNSVLATNGVGFDLPQVASLLSKSYSLFGQVEYRLTDTITAIAGLRASFERKTFEFEDLYVSTRAESSDPKVWDYAGALSLGQYNDKNKETLWNWKAQLNWKPSDTLLIYAGVTQGQKASSYNVAGAFIFANDGAGIPYKAERIVSYETGFKSNLFDNKLRFNSSVYYYDYHDYQAALWTGSSTILINVDAEFYGIEGEIAGNVTKDFEVALNGAWQHNTVKDVPVGSGFADTETSFAPEWTASAVLRYTYPAVIANGNVSLQASGSYQSSIWQNLNNYDANKLDAYFTADARLGWTSTDLRYSLAVFAKNIFNKRYETVGFDEASSIGANITSPGRPRWIGVNGRWNF